MVTRPDCTDDASEPLDPRSVELAVPVTTPATPRAKQRAPLRPDAPRILCVDDEPAVLKILTRSLEADFEVVTANDPRKALVLIEHGMDFSVVISDMKMPQMDGADFLARVARIAPSCTRLALTACLERELTSDEVFGILTKPCPLNLLHASVQAAVEHHALHALLQRNHQAVPVPAPLRHEKPRPGPDPDTMLLPHLAFDPWQGSRAPEPLAADAPRLSVLAGVAEKFFRIGNTAEAERIVRPALWDLLMRCEADRRASEREIDLAGRLALRLAEDTESAHWIEYTVRVYTSIGRPFPTELIEQVQDLVRSVPGTSPGAFQRYLSVLRASRHEFGPSEQFAIRRIEALAALLSR